MFKNLDIQVHTEVVGSDGEHVRDDRILLNQGCPEGRRPSSSYFDRLGRLRRPQGTPDLAVPERRADEFARNVTGAVQHVASHVRADRMDWNCVG